MGGEHSAFRSLVPSASSAAVALLAGLRQHQQQQQQLNAERERKDAFSGSEMDGGGRSDNEDEDDLEREEASRPSNGRVEDRKRMRISHNGEETKTSEEEIDVIDEKFDDCGRKKKKQRDDKIEV